MVETTVTPRISGPNATRSMTPRNGQVGRRQQFAMFWLFGRLMVMLPLCWVGCGGDDDPSPNRAAQDQPSAPAPAPAPLPADPVDGTQTPTDFPPTDPNGVDPVDPTVQGPNDSTVNPDGNPDGTAAETKPQRPEDPSAWNRGDYFTAKAENAPKFIEAVKLAGTGSNTNSPTAAKMLADLLAPPEPSEDGGDANTQPAYQPTSYQTGNEVTEALVTGIVRNTTTEAGDILVGLLRGDLPTENDRQTVEAILKALAANPTTKNNNMLYHILTGAERIRPPSKTPEPADATNDGTNNAQRSDSIDAEGLRQMAFDSVKEDASILLRERLGEHISKPDVSKPQYDLFWDLLKENRAENMGAQLSIYRAKKTLPEVRQELEEFFVAYSSIALENLLGIASDDSNASAGVDVNAYDPTSGPKPSDPEMIDGIAGHLWQPSFATLIETRLKETELAQRSPVLLRLARTIPVDSTRAAVWVALRDSWTQGPSQLAEGASGQPVDDPGFLVVVKSLFVKSPTFRAAGRTGREKLIQVRPEWEKFIEDLTGAWRERLHAAALTQAEAGVSTAALKTTPQTTAAAPAEAPATQPATGSSTTGEPPTDALPLKLHKDAKPTAQYRVRWPDDVRARLPDIALGPMTVDYIRIEETASPTLRLAHYRRQLGTNERDVVRTDTSFRVDSFRPVPGTGRKRFMSVLIAQDAQNYQAETTQVDEGEKPPETEPLVIEILAIEMADPAAN